MISGLYLITDENVDGRLSDRVSRAISGGARIIQYREKNKPIPEQIAMAKELKELCHEASALFIVNDLPDVAVSCGADGVHLGQGDMSIDEVRKILGPESIIGISTNTMEQAVAAEREGADYIGVGSIYPTGTKGDAVLIGLYKLAEIRQAVDIPIVAIGGINRDRTPELVEAGADSVAIVSAVMGDPDPAMAAREIELVFNSKKPFPRGRVLTVAGSDSGGGAGIQADLKTITLLGSYGSSAITALTAQNTLGVKNIHPAPAEFVEEQIEAVLSDIGADVIKTGMLFSADIIRVVAHALKKSNIPAVIDPVMIAKGGTSLMRQEATAALIEDLLPASYLITPNIPEAQTLTGITIKSEDDMAKAARKLCDMGARNVLLKGGHLEGDAVDILLESGRLHRFLAERLNTPHTHGTGCTFSAAIATFLAQGVPLAEAVSRGKEFTTEAIRSAPALGRGHGPLNHYEAAQKARKL